MFDPSVMIMADEATRRHVLSARPNVPTTPERPPPLPAMRCAG